VRDEFHPGRIVNRLPTVTAAMAIAAVRVLNSRQWTFSEEFVPEHQVSAGSESRG
jgi:hypothetical protein